jgi:hypothetical protein
MDLVDEVQLFPWAEGVDTQASKEFNGMTDSTVEGSHTVIYISDDNPDNPLRRLIDDLSLQR